MNQIKKNIIIKRIRLGKSTEEPMTQEEKERNVIFIYQIPLVVPPRPERTYTYNSSELESYTPSGNYSSFCAAGIAYVSNSSSNYSSFPAAGIAYVSKPSSNYSSFSVAAAASAPAYKTRSASLAPSRGFDNAMLKVSKNDKGQFVGLTGKTLVRDTNYPIRCTLQYYWVTDSMELSENLVKTISEQLNKFYDNSENKSSLVVGITDRPTEPKLSNFNLNELPQFNSDTMLNKFF
jgi:hypothetical protein